MFLKILLAPTLALIVIVSYFHFFIGSGRFTEGKIVQTKSGQIRGNADRSRDGREFYQWLGVPYAEPPVGPLRFASPKPVKNWKGILDGTKYGAQCPHFQMGIYTIIGYEDCLHTNIYIPKLNRKESSKLLPVMIFLHGGGFVMGAGNDYGPDYFMDEDVVLVTVNYRFGILGFLSTGDEQIRGNMGLKDQAEALRWIKSNIEHFGGDPNNILIFGESAGGASVHYMTLSDKTRGLFHKAVSLSGTALSPWGFWPVEKAVAKTKSLAQNLGCPTDNSRELTECLRGKDLEELILAFKHDVSTLIAYNPWMDGQILSPTNEVVDDDEAFLTEPPYDILTQGKQHKIPWMTGVTKDEGLVTSWSYYREDGALEIVENNFDKCAQRLFGLSRFPKKNGTEATQKLRDFYFGSDTPLTDAEKLERYTQMYSDGFFFFGNSEAARIQRKFSPVYAYHYERPGGVEEFSTVMSEMKRNTKLGPVLEFLIFGVKFVVRKYVLGLPGVYYGVGHAADLFLLFPVMGGIARVSQTRNPDDYQFSKDLVKLFVSFAKDVENVEFRGIKFPPVSKTGPLMYFNINEEPFISPEPFAERTDVWRSFNYVNLYSSSKNKK